MNHENISTKAEINGVKESGTRQTTKKWNDRETMMIPLAKIMIDNEIKQFNLLIKISSNCKYNKNNLPFVLCIDVYVWISQYVTDTKLPRLWRFDNRQSIGNYIHQISNLKLHFFMEVLRLSL